MRKQIILFLIALIIIPVKVSALSGNIKITCEKQQLTLGNTTSCSISGEITGSVSSVHSVINVTDGLELTSVTVDDIWEGDNDKVLDLYTADNKTGVFNIAKFTIKARTVGNHEIYLSETTLGDEKFKEHSFSSAAYHITVGKSEEDGNSSSKPSSSSSSSLKPSSSSPKPSSSSNKPSSSSSSKYRVLYPACNNDLVYNGKDQALVNKNDGYTVKINNEVSNMQKNAGKYKVNISLKQGYTWEDDSTSDITMTCKIKKAKPNLKLIIDKKTVNVGETANITIKSDVAGDLYLINSYSKFLNITDKDAKKLLNIQYIKTTIDDKIDKKYTIEALKNGSIILTAGLDPYDSTNYEVLSVGALIVKSVGEDTKKTTPKFELKIDKETLNVGDYSIITFTNDVPGTVSLSSSDSSILMLSGQELILKANSTTTTRITGSGAGKGKVSIIFTPDDNEKYHQVIKELELSVSNDDYSSHKITPIYSISLGDSTLKVNENTTLSFASSVPGRVTITSGNAKIVTTSSSAYNLSENEEKIFKLLAKKNGTTTITVEFVPSDNDKYNGLKKIYNLTVKKAPSSSNENVDSNPPTGNLLYLLIGLLGFGAITYSFICFKKGQKK